MLKHIAVSYKISVVNAFYTRAITKLIKNTAKMHRPANASVSMQLLLNNGQGYDKYVLCRSWILSDSIDETFSVVKNDVHLSEDATADFEKYILSLIPPELFNLYFFDGEKIADFFLEEGSNTRIKEAFLTLCGYDTFEIMRKNFKRIGTSIKNEESVLQEYLAAKEEYEKSNTMLLELESQLSKCLDDLANCSAEIDQVDRNYHQTGGISEEEHNQKLLLLKEEEKKRES